MGVGKAGVEDGGWEKGQERREDIAYSACMAVVVHPRRYANLW